MPGECHADLLTRARVCARRHSLRRVDELGGVGCSFSTGRRRSSADGSSALQALLSVGRVQPAIRNLRGFYVQSTSFGGAGCKLVAHASLSSNGQELGWRWSALETLLCRGRLRFCRAHVTLQDVILLPWELRSTHLATRTFVVSVMQGVPLDQDLG